MHVSNDSEASKPNLTPKPRSSSKSALTVSMRYVTKAMTTEYWQKYMRLSQMEIKTIKSKIKAVTFLYRYVTNLTQPPKLMKLT
jgi:hypothetical protein